MKQIYILLKKEFNLFFFSKGLIWILIIFIISLCSMLRLLLPLDIEKILFILKTSNIDLSTLALITKWANVFYIVLFLTIYFIISLFVILVSYQWDLNNNVIHFFKILRINWHQFFISKLLSSIVFLLLTWCLLGFFYFFLVNDNIFHVNLYTVSIFIILGLLISYTSSVVGLLMSAISLLTSFSFIFIFILFIPLQLPVISVFASLVNQLVISESFFQGLGILYSIEALFLYVCICLYTVVVILLFPYLWDSH